MGAPRKNKKVKAVQLSHEYDVKIQKYQVEQTELTGKRPPTKDVIERALNMFFEKFG
jgi:hypothetical protein